MPSMLDHALAWARRGFKVFPLVEGGKTPVVSNFSGYATSDEELITSIWRDPVTGWTRGYNIGVLTNDYVVVDVDVKDNKPGLDNYHALGGHFETLTVRTPSGGYHCYFVGQDSANTYPAPGVDIRSHNGYVLAPGSVVNGAEYVLLLDRPLAWVPAPIEERLRSPGARSDRAYEGELDTPEAIANAEAWLAEAEAAVEGSGGDALTYRTAAALVRDYALSEEIAFELMLRLWNERCSPPWGAEELWHKVENAANYGRGDVGAALPSTTFGSVVLPPVTSTFERSIFDFGNALEAVALAPRPWLVPRLLMRRDTTLLLAPGGSGKSSLVLALAAHGALGLNFGAYRMLAPFKTIIYNPEDDVAEQSRRLLGVCHAYGLDYAEVRKSIMLLSRDQLDLCLVQNVRGTPVMDEPSVQGLINLASSPDVGLLVMDPLIELHSCDESDNMHMRYVMNVVHRIARSADVSVLLPHHTSKGPGGVAGQTRAGNADVGRGASSIVNSSRIAVTLFGMEKQDRETYGISEADRHLYVRLDDAKMNQALASGRATWLKKEGVKLFNGDEVGVLKACDMTGCEEAMRLAMAQTIRNAIRLTSGASITLQEAVIALQTDDLLYEKMPVTTVRKKIEQTLKSGVLLVATNETITFRRNESGVIAITLT